MKINKFKILLSRGKELLRQSSPQIFPCLGLLLVLLVTNCSGLATQLSELADADINTAISCPNNYVVVPANSAVGQASDFCLAKYEMKKNGSVAKSEAVGTPWVSISQTSAITECSNLGAKYHLITNPEWMTLARNIENVASNWSTGTVGSGTLARGWSASTSMTPVDAWQNSSVASTTDASCLYNTGTDTCGSSGTHLYKRTHTLSNGKVIWDISGNVWEWNNWQVTQTDKAWDGTSTTVWVEFTAVDTNIAGGAVMQPSSWQATNVALSSSNSIGRYYAGSANSAAVLRGGDWFSGSLGGVFALLLNNAPSDLSTAFGFRCARSK